MEKSKEMVEKVLEKMVAITDEDNFRRDILSMLDNDYECEHFLRLMDKYDVQIQDNVAIIAIIIGEVAKKSKRKGDYLKDIDRSIEPALLDKNLDADENDEDDDLEDIDFYETVKDAAGGDTTAKWNLVNYIALGYAVSYSDEYDLDKLYYDNLCELAEKKEAAAYIMLGDAVLKGESCEQDTDEAIRWYEKAVEAGINFGNECIGEIYYTGEYKAPDFKKAYEYFTKDKGRKSFCTLYHLAEMYRRGLHVMQNGDKANEYYQQIVSENGAYCKMDDYYWRACYRLGMALYTDWETEASLKSAFCLLTEAKELYGDEKSGNEDRKGDITKEELYQNWQMVEQEVISYKKMRNEMPVIMKVRCVVDDITFLTKDKAYEVLTEEHGLYGLVDDEDDGIYLYSKNCFEVIEDYGDEARTGMSKSTREYEAILNSISSGLTGNYEMDIGYLKEQMDAYKDHAMGKEILRACGRLIYDLLPEEKKEEFAKAIQKDEFSTKVILEEVKFNISKTDYRRAISLIESLILQCEEGNLYQDDRVSEYHDFDEIFEQMLYEYRERPDKEIRQVSVPYSEIYYLYGYLLVEFRRYDEARAALKTALRWNPVNTAASIEYAETYKATGEWDAFFAYTIEAFKIAFRAGTVARCYRNLGYYFVEKALYPVAVACYLLSLEYEPDSELARTELYYIHKKAQKDVPELSEEDIEDYAERYGFPLHADDDIVGLSYACGEHYFEENLKDHARYFLTIANELTDLEKVKDMLKKLDE